ncbi:TIGR01777 family oxidoreductase [Carboxylicivirga taeanensis]|uniref:TIGR01777 family oxidoreductase n=1 Tax=Carboxylicivirga taeanensis TaxID=1416875 RepID=UPI003F6E221B
MPQRRRNNRVAVSGATGFIGRALSNFLESNGYEVIRLKRQHFKSKKSQLRTLLKGCSVVINLAGAPIAARKWTPNYKKEILNSRINTTGVLVDAIKEMEPKPELFISASAVGIYDSYEVHDEFSTSYATDFLGTVCQAWEAEACKVQRIKDVRLCIVRLGVVLGNEGGAFPKMLRPFKLGLGAKLGDGHQVFPYIHLNDVLNAFWYIIQHETSSGIYNLVAPQMLSNLEITEAIKQRTKKSILPVIPEKILRMLLGEGANALLIGQKVVPDRLEKDGFTFEFPTIEAVLDDLIC